MYVVYKCDSVSEYHKCIHVDISVSRRSQSESGGSCDNKWSCFMCERVG